MILITGANGLIGRALATHFIDKSKLRLQVRNIAKLESLFPGMDINDKADIVELDFQDADTSDFERLVHGCTTIIHLAGMVHNPRASKEEFDQLNILATKQLAAASKAKGVGTFVFFSSMNVYGSGTLHNVSEDDALKPETLYGISKAECEQWLIESPPSERIIVFRPALVFGEGDRGNMLSLIKRVASGFYFLIGEGTAQKSLIYAKDAALAVDLCLQKTNKGHHVFNLANEYKPSVKELLTTIAYLCQDDKKPLTLPLPIALALAKTCEIILGKRAPLNSAQIERLTTNSTCSIAALQKATGFQEKYSFKEALLSEIKWAAKEKILPKVLVSFLMALGLGLFFQPSTQAQQTIINVPSADITPEGQVYEEPEFQFRPMKPGRYFFYTNYAAVGVGHNTELDLTLSNVSSPSNNIAISPGFKTAIPIFKRKFPQREYKFIVGELLPISLQNHGFGSWTYVESSFRTPYTKTRITSGISYGTRQLFGQRALSYIGAIEQPITKRLNIFAEWYSGDNWLSYLTPGLSYSLPYNLTVFAGYQIPNSHHVSNSGFVIEVAKTFGLWKPKKNENKGSESSEGAGADKKIEKDLREDVSTDTEKN